MLVGFPSRRNCRAKGPGILRVTPTPATSEKRNFCYAHTGEPAPTPTTPHPCLWKAPRAGTNLATRPRAGCGLIFGTCCRFLPKKSPHLPDGRDGKLHETFTEAIDARNGSRTKNKGEQTKINTTWRPIRAETVSFQFPFEIVQNS
jgi:hypothetical protein